MQKPSRRPSTIGRPLDFGYATNRAIAALFAIAFVGFLVQALLTGRPWYSAGSCALSVFLAWAICREIDPDKDLAAFVAVTVCLPPLIVWGPGDALAMGWILLLLRVVNRSTGAAATPLDSLVVVGLGAWVCARYGLGVALLTAAGFLLNALIPPVSRLPIVFAIAGLLSSLIKPAPLHFWVQPAGLAALLCLVWLPMIVRNKATSTVGDLDQLPLDPRRVLGSQALAMATVLIFAATSGWAGLLACVPLGSAIAVSALWRLFGGIFGQ